MSALTEKRKREIEEQYAEMRKKAEKKLLLYVICNIDNVDEGQSIAQQVLKDIYKIEGIESASYTYGTNTILMRMMLFLNLVKKH
jgi:hypothetical protein